MHSIVRQAVIVGALANGAAVATACRTETAPTRINAVVASTSGPSPGQVADSAVSAKPTSEKVAFLTALREIGRGLGETVTPEMAGRLFDVSLEKAKGPYWTGKSRRFPLVMVAGSTGWDAPASELELVPQVVLGVTLSDLEATFGTAMLVSRSKTSHVRFPNARVRAGTTVRAELLGAPDAGAPALRIVLHRAKT